MERDPLVVALDRVALPPSGSGAYRGRRTPSRSNPETMAVAVGLFALYALGYVRA
jgi:hypothetical protein